MPFTRTELLQAATLTAFLRETSGRLFSASELRDAADQIESTRKSNHAIAVKAAEWMQRTHGVKAEIVDLNAFEYKLVYTYTYYSNDPDFVNDMRRRDKVSEQLELPEAEGFPEGSSILFELKYFDVGNW